MTQVVLMLYEDPQADKNSDKRFHTELHFSPGVKCHSAEAAKDPRFDMFHKERKHQVCKSVEEDVEPAPNLARSRRMSGSVAEDLNLDELLSDKKEIEKKERTTAKRKSCGRSRSECEYPAKSSDTLDESLAHSDGKRGASPSRYKAISKSLGKCDANRRSCFSLSLFCTTVCITNR